MARPASQTSCSQKIENSNSKNQYSIFYENVWSLDSRLQAQDRIHRIGQNSICVYKDLVVKGTIDEQIIKAIQQKKEIADFILEKYEKGEDNKWKNW